MADDYGSWITRNRFFNEIEQPTDTKGLMAPGGNYGGSPEQLRQALAQPFIQKQLAQFGIQPHPELARQSPFFNNAFMQMHPHMGGALTNALANVAATPNPEQVQGFGAGFNQAAQGLMGGPEMLRQYQIRQLMAPFQQMGMMVPGMEFQRKGELLELLKKQQEDASARGDRALEEKQREAEYKRESTKPEVHMGPYGRDIETYQTPQPQGGQSGLDMTLGAGPQRFMQPMQGGAPMQMPGWGLSPAIQGGWNSQYIPYDKANVADVSQGKETPALAAQREGAAQGSRDRGQAALIGAQGKAGAAQAKFGQRKQEALNKIEAEMNKQILMVQADTNPSATDEWKRAQIARIQQNAEQQKRNLEQGYQSGMGQMGAGGAGSPQPQQPQPQVNAQEINQHPEMAGQKPGWYRDRQTGGTFFWDGKQVGTPPAQGAPNANAPAAPTNR